MGPLVQSYLSDTKFILTLLFQTMKEDKKIVYHFYASLFFIIVTIALNICAPLSFTNLIQGLPILEDNQILECLVLVLFYGTLWASRQITIQLREILCFPIIEVLLVRLTKNLFNKLLSFPLTHYKSIPIGNISDSICRTQENFPGLFMGIFLHILPTLAEISLILYVLSIEFSGEYSVIFFISIIIYLLFTLWGINNSSLKQNLYIQKRKRMQSYLADRLQNFDIIKQFSQEDQERQAITALLEDYKKSKISSDIFIESIRLGQGFILGIVVIVITLLGAINVINDQISIEKLILLNFYFIQMVSPLSFLGIALKDTKKGFANITDVIQLFHENPPNIFPEKPSSFLPERYYSLDFKNVFFYRGHTQILDNVTFQLRVGKTIGLIGKTGSGKSTIAHLIMGFLIPTKGGIFLGSHNIQDIPLKNLHHLIGYVPQAPTFFNDSVYNNLVYGHKQATLKDVEAAVELACMSDVIANLPEKYQTKIGQNGVTLSGGQLQRLCLARTFLSRPRFFILDEISSALDPLTQKAIRQNLRHVSTTSGFLIISHRYSFLTHADEILQLEEGRVASLSTLASPDVSDPLDRNIFSEKRPL